MAKDVPFRRRSRMLRGSAFSSPRSTRFTGSISRSLARAAMPVRPGWVYLGRFPVIGASLRRRARDGPAPA
jgi:hypothetical protein